MGSSRTYAGSCGQVREAKHACSLTDKDTGSLRLWASLPRAHRTRAVLTGESQQTRKGCLLLCEWLCANRQPQEVGLLCPSMESSKQPSEDFPS